MTQLKKVDMTYICDANIKTNAYFRLKKLFIHSFYKSHYHFFDNAYVSKPAQRLFMVLLFRQLTSFFSIPFNIHVCLSMYKEVHKYEVYEETLKVK